MNLKVLGSSSSGNCYIIQDKDEAIIIEAGVSLMKVKQALNFNIKKVKGVLISHLHGDHSKYSKDYENSFQIYCNKSVIETRKLSRAKEIRVEQAFMVGNFKVFPFKAEHDVPTLGFILQHEKFGFLLFLTDSFLCDYVFDDLNHILIEANYSDLELQKSVANGLHHCVEQRLYTTHMEIDTTRRVLLNQDLSKVYNIVLIHLSGNNSDPENFKKTISEATGKPIHIAKPGLEIELTKNPY